ASVEEALTTSVAAFAASLAERTGEGAGTFRFPQRTIVHERTGVRLDPRTPVVVGAGQVVQRDPDPAQPRDPVALAVDALRRAGDDSGAGEEALRAADAVYAVASASWTYRDAAALVAEALGAEPSETAMSAPYGGGAGQGLVNTAAPPVPGGRAQAELDRGAEYG